VGNITEYTWQFDGGEPDYVESENPPPIQYNTFGTYSVKLIAKSASSADSIIRYNYIKVLPTLSPNPSLDGNYKLSFGKEIPKNILVEIYDLIGRKISPVFLIHKSDGLYFDISTHEHGMYLIHLITDDREQIIKAIYLNNLK
jgi:hypothetical protein